MALTPVIAFWLDSVSYPGDPCWVVTLDRFADPAMQDLENTQTISEHPTRTAAQAEALRQADRRNLSCVYTDEEGHTYPVRRGSPGHLNRVR